MEALLAQVPVLMLVAARIAGVTASSPVFSNRFMTVQSRVLFTVLLGLLIMPAARVAPGALEGPALLLTAAGEVLIGLVIGFASHLIFSAVQMAGALIDMELGFGMAQIFDPVSGRAEPILSTFFQTLALVIYLGIDAHHWLLRALASSYEVLAAGSFFSGPAVPLTLVQYFSFVLTAAVQIALPFTAVLLFATVALGGLSKAVPQLNVFAVGIGIKTVAGLALLAVMLPYLMGSLERLFSAGHVELMRMFELVR